MLMRLEQLPCIVDRDVVVPSFLEQPDHPWLQRLIERAASAEGLRYADVEEHLIAPLPLSAPPAKHRLAAFILAKLLKTRTAAHVEPKLARERLFDVAAAAAAGADRHALLSTVAGSFGISADELRTSLFADLAPERVVRELAEPPSPGLLAAKANLWLAQAYIARATRVTLDVKGTSKPLVQNAKAKGLLCTIVGTGDGTAAVLELSGPMSLFKNTRLYGRALAALLPSLAWCDRWIVDADCRVADRTLTFRVSTGAPILPSTDAPRRFDSRVEERFAKDFEQARIKRGLPWTLVRDPRPIVVDENLIFPDFALEPAAPGAAGAGGGAAAAGAGARPTFVELVGFWTPQYLEDKLSRYRRARLANLVLCVDEELGCADGAIPAHAKVVRFRRRVDVDAVLAAAAAAAAGAGH